MKLQYILVLFLLMLYFKSEKLNMKLDLNKSNKSSNLNKISKTGKTINNNNTSNKSKVDSSVQSKVNKIMNVNIKEGEKANEKKISTTNNNKINEKYPKGVWKKVKIFQNHVHDFSTNFKLKKKKNPEALIKSLEKRMKVLDGNLKVLAKINTQKSSFKNNLIKFFQFLKSKKKKKQEKLSIENKVKREKSRIEQLKKADKEITKVQNKFKKISEKLTKMKKKKPTLMKQGEIRKFIIEINVLFKRINALFKDIHPITTVGRFGARLWPSYKVGIIKNKPQSNRNIVKNSKSKSESKEKSSSYEHPLHDNKDNTHSSSSKNNMSQNNSKSNSASASPSSNKGLTLSINPLNTMKELLHQSNPNLDSSIPNNGKGINKPVFPKSRKSNYFNKKNLASSDPNISKYLLNDSQKQELLLDKIESLKHIIKKTKSKIRPYQKSLRIHRHHSNLVNRRHKHHSRSYYRHIQKVQKVQNRMKKIENNALVKALNKFKK